MEGREVLGDPSNNIEGSEVYKGGLTSEELAAWDRRMEVRARNPELVRLYADLKASLEGWHELERDHGVRVPILSELYELSALVVKKAEEIGAREA